MAVSSVDISRVEADTRDFYSRTVVDQVHDRIPLIYKLRQMRRVITKGGTNIRLPLRFGKNTQTQHYIKGQPMGSGTEDKRTAAKFGFMNTQTPIKYDLDDFLNNNGDEQIVDTIQAEVKSAQEDMVDSLSDTFFTTSENVAGEPYGLMAALSYNTTYGGMANYGGITRGTGDNDPIALADSGTAPVTWFGGWVYTSALSATMSNLRKGINACMMKRGNRNDMLILTTPGIFMKYQALLDAKHALKQDGMMAKAGFTAMTIDGIEMVLDDNCPADHLFILSLTTWQWRINPKRNFKLTGFKWQGEVNDGVDEWLARIVLRHNLVCDKPIANLVYTSMS